VRRVVWGYQVGMLPVPWLMGFKRLKATLEREGFAIRVELLPLTSVPADADLLFVPDDLAEGARQAAPDAQVIALGSRPEQAVFQVLVEQLRAGTELSVPAPGPVPTASTAAPEEQDTSPPPPTRGTIVRYRGWERID
jgi:mannitol-specific phosphotransferase system IIBC component